MAEPIRISDADLRAKSVDDYVETQRYLNRDESIEQPPWLVRVIYANWFYLSIAAMVGGLVGWACVEPFFDDNSMGEEVELAAIVMFPAVAGSVGLFLGAAEGLMCRNLLRAIRSGAVGLGIGFLGGLIALVPTGLVFTLMSSLAVGLWDDPQPDQMPTGFALLVFVMGRGIAWSIASIPAGMGQGIALRERKVILNGMVGAVLGGLVGGLLFDPIYLLFETDDGGAELSRAVGFGTIGLMVGLFVGLVEGWTKTAWLLMQKGPLAGKQFILFKDSTVLGSSPKADVYLFKDDAIEPQHAVVTNRGGRFEIEDGNTPAGTIVNGAPVKRHVLSDGDQIILGKTVLEFSMRETGA